MAEVIACPIYMLM